MTEAVLTTVPARFHGGVDDGLLTGLAVALGLWRRGRGVAVGDAVIAVEGHGREEQVLAGADLSRTVGWFTTMFPVRLALAGIDLDEVLAGGAAAGAAVKAVKEQLRAVPDHGIGYGLLRYLNPDTGAVLRGVGHRRRSGSTIWAGSNTGAGAGPTGAGCRCPGAVGSRVPGSGCWRRRWPSM